MASPVDIMNAAIGHCGGEANVQSISPPEATVEAENAAKFYPIARDALLEMHNWYFAMKRKLLTPVTLPSGVYSWQFAYTVPSDCMTPISVLAPGASDDMATADFVTEAAEDGSLILYTNLDQATLRYKYRVTDTSKFTPLFTVALEWLAGSYMAGPLLKGKAAIAVADRCLKMFINFYGQATTMSANTAQLNDSISNRQPIWIQDR